MKKLTYVTIALIALFLAGLMTVAMPASITHAQGPVPTQTIEERATAACNAAGLPSTALPLCKMVMTIIIGQSIAPTNPVLPPVVAQPPVVVTVDPRTPPANWNEDSSLFAKGADDDVLFPKIPKTRRQFQLTWFHARPAPGPSIGSCYLRVGDDEKVIAKGGQRTFYYTGKPDAANRVPVIEIQNLVRWWTAVLENPKLDPGYCSEVSGRYIVTYQWSWMAVGTDTMSGRPQ